jgi:recombination protein U
MSVNELETRVRKANLRYRKERKALIQKLEVPIRMTAMGMVATLSTVDFYGIFSYTKGKKKIGKPIAFDAKECESLTSFPLKNIHQHQLEFLKLWNELGGEGFFFVHFKKVHPDHAHVVPLSLISKYWDNDAGRKSIPISEFKDEWLAEIDNYLEYLYGRYNGQARATRALNITVKQ